jgi:hypothetical protein
MLKKEIMKQAVSQMAMGPIQDARHPEERRRRDVGTQDKKANFLKFSHSFFNNLFRINLSFTRIKLGPHVTPSAFLGMTGVFGAPLCIPKGHTING